MPLFFSFLLISIETIYKEKGLTTQSSIPGPKKRAVCEATVVRYRILTYANHDDKSQYQGGPAGIWNQNDRDMHLKKKNHTHKTRSRNNYKHALEQ